MQEFNRHTLEKALAQLKIHLPDEHLWDSIEENLDMDDAIHDKVQHLKHYSPPDLVWEKINQELDVQPKLKKLTWLRPLLAAASIAILVTGFFFFGNGTLNAGKVVEEYTIEQYPNTRFQRKNYNNKHADDAIKALVNAQKISKDDNKNILSELDELKKASDKLSGALGKYDTNIVLREKLDAIEKERMNLMNELLEEIKI